MSVSSDVYENATQPTKNSQVLPLCEKLQRYIINARFCIIKFENLYHKMIFSKALRVDTFLESYKSCQLRHHRHKDV